MKRLDLTHSESPVIVDRVTLLPLFSLTLYVLIIITCELRNLLANRAIGCVIDARFAVILRFSQVQSIDSFAIRLKSQ